MTTLTKLPPELQAKLDDIRAGRPPRPTTKPVTTLAPPKEK